MDDILSCARPDEAAAPDLLYLLMDVARLLRREIDRRARMHDMNRTQWVMMIKLSRHPGLSQKDLAEILEVEPMTVARLTDRLEARGLVERRADPRDRRIWRLHLTKGAAPLLGDIEIQREAAGSDVARNLSPAIIEATRAGLLGMKMNLLAAEYAAHDYIGANDHVGEQVPGRSIETEPAEQEIA